MPYYFRSIVALLGVSVAAGILLAGQAKGADRVLFDFDARFDPSAIEVRDATISRLSTPISSPLRVKFGHAQKWPGFTLPAPGQGWDLSAYQEVVLQVRNVGTNPGVIACRVDSAGATGTKNCVTGSLSLAPGKSGTLKVRLTRAGDNLGGKLFGMRGYPVGTGAGEAGVDPANITALVVFMKMPDSDQEFEIGDIRAEGVATLPTASVTDATPFFPFIDTFGQYKHRTWPGKVRSSADLSARRESEAAELEKMPGPADWDKYGGWTGGPELKASGFFRTEKYQEKWWLVDPDGRLFFSQGITCVRDGDNTPVEKRETWFEEFPGNKPEFKDFLGSARALLGHYAGQSPESFSFSKANLLRKYGAEWRSAYAGIAHRRLRSWGVNTIGNWSDEKMRLMDQTPYVDTIGTTSARVIEGSNGYWSKFPDVFDPGFAETLRKAMAFKVGKSAGDRWCIGFFSDNEMAWGDQTSLALAALQSPPDQAAKKEFLADLQTKYGDISKLNAAWGVHHASWDALLESRDAPDKNRALDDLTTFYTKVAETYFRTAREEIRKVAPNQLYLGCRFAGVNDLAAQAAAKSCDVVSYNIYRRSIAEFPFPGGDKPLLVGEFHFGALDRGMFHPGLVPVSNQAERARAYTDYVQGALRHPLFVGVHWFEWMDEPTTGRTLDEENFQIGFVDGADTPYPEMVAASRAIAAGMYQARAGK